MTALLAAIPPPPFSEFHLGPLTIRMYGIMIGLGVLAGTWLGGKLMVERGVGDNEDAAAITVWAVAAGVIGARLYHVVTNLGYFRDHLLEIPMIWKPGLGIPGGILFGAIAGVIVARRRDVPVLAVLSCAAPALPLAQSIGRWGNYFNQELYGRQTTLPWGLEVDPAYRIAGDGPDVLYHPTFLYESLWNLGLCLVLLWVFRNVRLQPGRLFALYLVGYGSGRLWIETLRIDPANAIGPFRVNIWMSLLLIVGGAAWFVGTRNSAARWPRQADVGSSRAGSRGLADNHTGADVEDHDATPVAGTLIEASAGAGDMSTSHSRESGSDHDETAGDGASPGELVTRQADGVDAAVGGPDRRGDVANKRAAPNPSTEQVDAGTSAAKKPAAAKQAAATKAAAKKAPAKKVPAKKAPAKKAPTKKAPAKKAAAKKAAAKKTAAKKAPAKKTAAKKAPAKKAAAKKAPAKKTAAKKAEAKKAPAKKTAAKKAAAKKAAAKKAPATKTLAKKSPSKKAPAKKTLAKKAPAKKAQANKATTKKSTAKKAVAKKAPAK